MFYGRTSAYNARPYKAIPNTSQFITFCYWRNSYPNGDCHPCAYLSKSLTKEQRNYDTRDRELLAIVCVLKEWQHHIQGSGHTTTILSDHNNLRHFKVPQTIGR